MSADNGIYILITKNPQSPLLYEYRVCHAQAIDNICWEVTKDEKGKDKYVEHDEPWMPTVREYWNKSPVFHERSKALEYADKLLSETYICEYGISFIDLRKETF